MMSRRLPLGFVLALLLSLFTRISNGIEHNLPPDVEIVDPRTLGFDESALAGLLGQAKLLPINSQVDPKTGLRTQVLTVGFDKDEDLNLDDFELPSNSGGNNSELVQNAFASFKNYVKSSGPPTISTSSSSSVSTSSSGGGGGGVIKKKKIVKKPVEPKPSSAPKVVELESDQIEKLLASGKLKSKKVGDNQVIEITQEQLDALLQGDKGQEYGELLGLQQGNAQQSQSQQNLQPIVQQRAPQPQPQAPRVITTQVQSQQSIPVPVTTKVIATAPPPPPPQPSPTPQRPSPSPSPTTTQRPVEYLTPQIIQDERPIIYSFNTKDIPITNNHQSNNNNNNNNNNYDSYRPVIIQNQNRPALQAPISSLGGIQYVNTPPVNQVSKHIRTPTFEFISVPPVTSFSSLLQNPQPQQTQQKFVEQRPQHVNIRGKVLFPGSSISNNGGIRVQRLVLPEEYMNTYYEDDGLNYKDNSNGKSDKLRGV